MMGASLALGSLACRPPPIPADQVCAELTPLVFAVAQVSFEFPDSAEVHLHVARDANGDGAISATELESLAQYTDARSPLGMALSRDADTVHVLYEDRLVSADGVTGEIADVGLVATEPRRSPTSRASARSKNWIRLWRSATSSARPRPPARRGHLER